MQVRLLLLAALAGEHLLLLGPPGTAKSELSRRMSKLTGGQYYERLLTRFSVPEVGFRTSSAHFLPGLLKTALLSTTERIFYTMVVEVASGNTPALSAIRRFLSGANSND